ncbi:hypothetical protein [Lysinibacillus sphaericus]|uniref:hypothetical protein n=1 Tax=Lysinibacillus sphaericus TaxID=1421 RepID=UPI003F792B22
MVTKAKTITSYDKAFVTNILMLSLSHIKHLLLTLSLSHIKTSVAPKRLVLAHGKRPPEAEMKVNTKLIQIVKNNEK